MLRAALAGVGLLSLSLATIASAEPSAVANASASASALVLDGEGSSSTHVAKEGDVVLSTSALQGCTLTATSGSIQRAGGTPIAFQVTTVAEGAAPPSQSAFTTPSGSQHQFSTATSGTATRQLFIRYTPSNLQDPGSYAASILVSVLDN